MREGRIGRRACGKSAELRLGARKGWRERDRGRGGEEGPGERTGP